MSRKYFRGLLWKTIQFENTKDFPFFPRLHKTDEVYCDEDEDDFDEGKEGQKGLGVSYTDCQ